MKKNFIFYLIIAILLGTFTAKLLYSNNIAIPAFNENKIYFLQYASYEDKKVLQKNIRSVNPNLVLFENGKYNVYVAITANYNNLNKIKKVYTDNNINLYEKSKNITNTEFINNLEQFDLLLEKTTDKDEILAINEVILSNYEQNNKNN